MEAALDAGADDVVREDDVFHVTCAAQAYDAVRKGLEAKKVPIQHKEITKAPGSTVPVNADAGAKVLKLIEMFEDHDDVQHVYTNFDMPEEVMAKLG